VILLLLYLNKVIQAARQQTGTAHKMSMHRNLRRALSIDIKSGGDVYEESFIANGDVFIKDDVAINATGVAMRNNAKKFTLAYDDLEIGEIIGRGASSVVLRGSHAPSRTPVALKVINLFDRSKREQLIREIITLYDAQCPSLITFYGAFYREGSITIALEFMDGGSLANVLAQVGPMPESVLANMTYQILWGLAYLKHEKRVHRDMKPSNLLINSKGEVKVISALDSVFLFLSVLTTS
jgi:mitogen-activated protein kinase kinase 3